MIKEKILPVQFQEAMIKEIEGYIKGGLYSSKAEFIREAVRKNIIELRKQLFFARAKELKNISKSRGAGVATPFLTEKQKREALKGVIKRVKAREGQEHPNH